MKTGQLQYEKSRIIETMFNATFQGDFDRCKEILKDNAKLKVNVRDVNGSTLLITACQALCNEKDTYSFVLFLIENGAYIMEKDALGNSAAYYAHRFGMNDVVDLLYNAHAQIIREILGI